MKNFILTLLLLLCVHGCAVLSKKELSAVRSLTAGADSLGNTPAVLFRELGLLRMERGIFYASSFYGADNVAAELERVAEQYVYDSLFLKKASVSCSIMSSYLRALRSLASDARFEDIAVQLRNAGRYLDDGVEAYDDIVPEKFRIGEIYAEGIGKVSGALGSAYMRSRQHKFLKGFVCDADTVVSLYCEGMSRLLESGEVDSLIVHEELMLKRDFASFLARCESAGTVVSPLVSRAYVDCLVRLERVKYVRKRSVAALSAFRKAHGRLKEGLMAKGDGLDGVGLFLSDMVDLL